MNENSPVQAITGQVDVVYDKAIIEIEKEESDLESQISRLVEKKSVLSRKSQLLNQLRVQVEQLTEEITTVEELYKTELKKKEELETLIQKVIKQLEELKNRGEKFGPRLEIIRNERRKKYQLLADMVEKFGDSVTSKLSDQVVADLEETIRISGGATPQHPRESGSDSSKTPVQEEGAILEDNTTRMATSLNLDDEEEGQDNPALPQSEVLPSQDDDTILEDDISQLSTLLDLDEEIEEDDVEELDSVLEGLDFGLEEDETDQAKELSPQRAVPTEKERLAEMFSTESLEPVEDESDSDSDSDDVMDFGLDAFSDNAGDVSTVDSPNISELSASSSQEESEGQGGIEDLLKNTIGDEAEQEEQPTANSALVEESDSDDVIDFGLDDFLSGDDNASANTSELSASSSQGEPEDQGGIEDLLKNMIGDEAEQEEQLTANSAPVEESDSDDVMDFSLDDFLSGDDDDSAVDLANLAELSASSSQDEPVDQGGIEDLLKNITGDGAEQEKQPTPKTAQTPRNHRNVLTSYLDKDS